MKTLPQLRKELAALGYKLTTQRLSWGPHATYHMKDGSDSLTYNVASAETWAKWEALRAWQKANKESLDALGIVPGTGGLNPSGGEGIYGLSNLAK